jgi:hypothetical protein
MCVFVRQHRIFLIWHRVIADGPYITTVILRCSPFFTASLEGWIRTRVWSSFETPRKRAAPQDDGGGTVNDPPTPPVFINSKPRRGLSGSR